MEKLVEVERLRSRLADSLASAEPYAVLMMAKERFGVKDPGLLDAIVAMDRWRKNNIGQSSDVSGS